MFLAQEQIEKSLGSIQLVHPFFGISFLVFKEERLPVGKTIDFSINHLEDQFLRQYFRPDIRSEWFFRAFRVSDKKQFWLRPDYAWKGSQSVRTRTFGSAFIHDKGTDQWGWQDSYIQELKGKLYKGRKIPAYDLAVWLYRDKDWPPQTTPQAITDSFIQQFNIDDLEIDDLFDLSFPTYSDQRLFLVDHQLNWEELLTKLEIPRPEDIPKDEGGTLFFLTIEGAGPARKIHLDLAERVNLFTGDNGLGKSFILESAWWALSGHWTSFPAYPREDAGRNEPTISFQFEGSSGKGNKGVSTYDWELQQWSFSQERPTIPGLLIYARVDGAFAVWDPARDYWAASGNTHGARPLVFSRDEIWNGLQDNVGGNTSFLSNGLIADWIHWQNSPEREPFDTLKRILKRLSPSTPGEGDLGPLKPGKPARIPRDSRWMPTIEHAYGEIPLVYASAGVRRIVALAYLIVWAWEEHKSQSKLMRKEPQRRMVTLIDEIEAHLHPKWQRKILPALLEVQQDLSANLHTQLLIATHSPLILASYEPHFDMGKDKIFHLGFTKENLLTSEITVEESDFVIYGTSDSWLTSEIFELTQARSVEAERAIEDAKKLQSREDSTKEEVEEVTHRLIKYLSAHDRFWTRWTFFAEEHGVQL